MRQKNIMRTCMAALMSLTMTVSCIGSALPLRVYAEEPTEDVSQESPTDATEVTEDPTTEPTEAPEETTGPVTATLERITLKELPLKCEYVVGQTIDLTGLVVQAHYSDGSVENVEGYQHTNPDTSSIGKKDVTISYRGFTAVFHITVVNRAVLDYQYTPPTKTQYIQDEPFDPTGLSMTMVYNDGCIETPPVEYDEPDMSVAGEQTVIFRWGNHTEKFVISIALKNLEKIVISGFMKTSYNLGEELNLSGMVVTAHFKDGTNQVVTDYTVSGFNPYQTGVQEVTISYGGMKTSFTVTVENFSPYTCNGGENCISNVFTDVDYRQWYHEGIDYVVNQKLMVGLSDTKFSPNSTTTRAMIVTILYRLAGSPAVEENDAFSDVRMGSWYSKAVVWASENGVVSGYGNGKFGPNDTITREQMATMMYRYAQFIGLDTSEKADLSSLPDVGKISGWAKEAMAWTYEVGMIVGIPQTDHVTVIEPKGNATRAQVAAIIYRFCEDVMP